MQLPVPRLESVVSSYPDLKLTLIDVRPFCISHLTKTKRGENENEIDVQYARDHRGVLSRELLLLTDKLSSSG